VIIRESKKKKIYFESKTNPENKLSQMGNFSRRRTFAIFPKTQELAKVSSFKVDFIKGVLVKRKPKLYF